MNAKALLLTTSVILLGAFSALPTSAAFARSADVSIDRADKNGGDKVSADKTGSRDATGDKASEDGQGDNVGQPMQLHAAAKAATSNSVDGSTDKNGGDKVSPDKNGSKDGSADKNSKDGIGSNDGVSKDGSHAGAGKAGKGEGNGASHR